MKLRKLCTIGVFGLCALGGIGGVMLVGYIVLTSGA